MLQWAKKFSGAMLLAVLALIAQAAFAATAVVSEDVIRVERQDETLHTEHPLIVANRLSFGDAKVAVAQVGGAAYVTRKSLGHVELQIGTTLLKGDLIELSPGSEIVIEIDDSHSTTLTASETTIWYKIE